MANADGDSEAVSLSRFARRAVIVAAIALATALAGYFLSVVGHGVLIVVAAILLAVMLDGLAAMLTGLTRLPRPWALAAVVLLLAALVFGGAALGGARMAGQIPELSQALQQGIDKLEVDMHRSGLQPQQWFGASGDQALSLAEHLFGSARNFITIPVGILTDLLVIVVVGIYLAVNPSLYLDSMVRLLPMHRRRRMYDVTGEIGHALRRWLVGRLCAMIAVGALVTGGLFLFHIKLALMLGFIAGMLTFVPYLGAVVSAIPALFVALLNGPLSILYVLGLFLLAHLLEGYVLMPWIQKRAVSMAPAFLLMAQMLGGLAAGVLGILLATPLAVSLAIAVQMLYLQDMLGEKVRILGEPGETAGDAQ